MHALCVSGAVNTESFAWKFFMRNIYLIHSFIHRHRAVEISININNIINMLTLNRVLRNFQFPHHLLSEVRVQFNKHRATGTCRTAGHLIRIEQRDNLPRHLPSQSPPMTALPLTTTLPQAAVTLCHTNDNSSQDGSVTRRKGTITVSAVSPNLRRKSNNSGLAEVKLTYFPLPFR